MLITIEVIILDNYPISAAIISFNYNIIKSYFFCVPLLEILCILKLANDSVYLY